MSIENEDYMTTRYIDDQTKQTQFDGRKSIGIASELDELFNDIMEERETKHNFLEVSD